MDRFKTLINVCALFIITLSIHLPAQAQSPECIAAKAEFKSALDLYKTTSRELQAAKKETIQQAATEHRNRVITEEEKESLISAAVVLFEESKIAAEAAKDEAEALKDAACEEDGDGDEGA